MATAAAAEYAAGQRRLFRHPAHLLYAICGTELVLSVALAFAFGFRAASLTAFLPHLYCVLLVACGPLLRRIAKPRTAGAFETVGFLYGQAFAVVAFLYPMTAVALPFADGQLAAADRALGFDWPSFAHFVGDHPVLLSSFWAAYFSFNWQAAIVFPALFIASQAQRAWTVILAANFALLLTIAIYPFFTAEGTFVYYGISPDRYANMTTHIAWLFGPVIHAIRDEGARYITRDLMVPLVSFPSYHATAALLFSWAVWPIRKMRWAVLMLNFWMTVSALIIGPHYLVDLLGGVVIGALSIPLAKRALSSLGLASSDLFQPPATATSCPGEGRSAT